MKISVPESLFDKVSGLFLRLLLIKTSTKKESSQHFMNAFLLRGRLYERNWYTFGSLRSSLTSKNELGLKIFLHYVKKKCTTSINELKSDQRDFYYFFRFQMLVFIIATFQMFYIQIYLIQYQWSSEPVRSEITLQHGCSLVTLLHIFRTPFCKNTYRCLLL